MNELRSRCGTLVIGGGQAGLAAAHHLSRIGEDVQVVEAGERPGEAWRKRWASLRLFTPAQYDGLPGMPFPAERGSFPTKDEMADYLAAYAAPLPVHCGVRVQRLAPAGQGFEAQTTRGTLSADRVVIATGCHAVPKVPPFAQQLEAGITQLHSSQYREPSMVPRGEVLVVGAGTSGLEIALDLAPTHRVHLAGKPTAHIPDPLFRYAGGLYWWFISNLLTERTPMGRKAKAQVRAHGAPLIRVSMAQVAAAGVEHVPRVTGIHEGKPVVEGGRVLPVQTVVWATGFRPDFSWVDAPITDEQGWPKAERGVSTVLPGLYFVGLVFQFGLTSGLVGGVGRDAAYVAAAIERARAGGRVQALSGAVA